MSDRRGKKPGRLAEAGFRLTPRDIALVLAVYAMRQLTREQAQTLLFSGRSPSIALRRIGLLRQHRWLTARRVPLERSSGATPYVYSIGSAAVPFVAERLGLSSTDVRKRQRLDANLSWVLYPHREMTTWLHVHLLTSCRAHGGSLAWRGDEELAVDRLPVRPDAFFAVALSAGRSAFFLEVQRESDGGKFAHKVTTYLPYYQSGAYTQHFGFRTLRVLTVTDSYERAANHQAIAERLGGDGLFWFAALDDLHHGLDVLAAPVWSVAGGREKKRLFAEHELQASARQTVAVQVASPRVPGDAGLASGLAEQGQNQTLNQTGTPGVTAPTVLRVRPRHH